MAFIINLVPKDIKIINEMLEAEIRRVNGKVNKSNKVSKDIQENPLKFQKD